MFTITLFLSLFGSPETSAIKTLKTFEAPQGDTYLGFPYSMCFSPEGKLYVVDRKQSQVMVWNKDGSYDHTFSQAGSGPGELIEPGKIMVSKNKVYVWAFDGRVSIFNLNGTFDRSFIITGVQPKAFAPLTDKLFLIGFRQFIGKGVCHNYFELRNEKGLRQQILHDFPNNGFVSPIKGDNNVTIVAYPPEVDIQQTSEGKWWYGFSQTKTLYEVDVTGGVRREREMKLKTSPPNQEEKDLFLNRVFAGPNSQRMTLKDLPNLKVETNRDKAYYTNFTIIGNKAVFALTPIGSTDSVGNGFSQATYSVNDFTTGELLHRGHYELAEDSVVLYQNGRIMAFIMGKDGEYRIQEITLKGL